MNTSTSASIAKDTTKPSGRRTWRVVDIVVASVIGVAAGVVMSLAGLGKKRTKAATS